MQFIQAAPITPDSIYIYKGNAITFSQKISNVDSIKLNTALDGIKLFQNNVVLSENLFTDVDSISFTGSYPVITNSLGRQVCGVVGGTMPVKFDVTLPNSKTLQSLKLKFNGGADINYTSGTEVSLDIPADIAASITLNLVVTATTTDNKVSVLTVPCSIVKNMYIYGKGTVSKFNTGYAMSMTQDVSNKNVFTFKTYIEAAGDGFRCFAGNITMNNWDKIVDSTFVWGAQAGKMVQDQLSFATNTTAGYKIISFNPTTQEYTISDDLSVPGIAEEAGMYAQVNNLQYNMGAGWTGANWNFIQFNAFPDNVHRFYVDVKNGGGGWDQAFFGLAAQNSGNWGTMYSLKPGGGWYYSNNGFAGTLEKVYSWAANGQLSEKGSIPSGTKCRMVVDTYLMQVGWATIDNYSYPGPTN